MSGTLTTVLEFLQLEYVLPFTIQKKIPLVAQSFLTQQTDYIKSVAVKSIPYLSRVLPEPLLNIFLSYVEADVRVTLTFKTKSYPFLYDTQIAHANPFFPFISLSMRYPHVRFCNRYSDVTSKSKGKGNSRKAVARSGVWYL